MGSRDEPLRPDGAFDKAATEMNFVIYLIVGGIAGWLASLLMRRDGSMGIIANVIVGILGGFLGGWALPKLGINFGSAWMEQPSARERTRRRRRFRLPEGERRSAC